MSQNTQNIHADFLQQQKILFPRYYQIAQHHKMADKLKQIESNNQKVLQGKLVLVDKIAALEQTISIFKSENDLLKIKVKTLEEELTGIENIVNRMYDSSACSDFILSPINDSVESADVITESLSETITTKNPNDLSMTVNNSSVSPNDFTMTSNMKGKREITSPNIEQIGHEIIKGITQQYARHAREVISVYICGMDVSAASTLLQRYGLTLCIALHDNDYTKSHQTDIHVSVTSKGTIKEVCRVAGWDVKRPRHPKHIYKRPGPPVHFHEY